MQKSLTIFFIFSMKLVSLVAGALGGETDLLLQLRSQYDIYNDNMIINYLAKFIPLHGKKKANVNENVFSFLKEQ